MPFSCLSVDPPRECIPSHVYSSEFVSKAMARLVKPIDPDDPEQNPSDLTVKCGSLDVKAHSFVLCQDSPYFKVICKGGFLEEQTRELRLPAEEEFLIRRLLCYRYTTGYNDEPYDDENTPSPYMKAPAYISRLHLNAQMYSMGDKYDISSLKEKAGEKFDNAIWEPQSGMYYAGSNVVEEMIKVIPLIYESTPDRDRGLRDRVIEVARRRDFEKHACLQDLVAAVPEFGQEIQAIYSHRLRGPPRSHFSF